jgi:hypothetical protein
MAKNAQELKWTDVLNRFIFLIFSNLFRSLRARFIKKIMEMNAVQFSLVKTVN